MARLSGASTRSRAEGTNGQSPGKSGLDGATGGRSRTLAHRPSGRGGRPHRATGSARAPGLASGASAHPGDAEAIEPDGSDAAGSSALRFSAKGFTKLRQRLGLSAAALGALLGVTAQSVYKWEDGKAHPRAAQLRAIAAIRKMGKREAAARLAEMNGHEEPAAASGAQVAQAAGA